MCLYLNLCAFKKTAKEDIVVYKNVSVKRELSELTINALMQENGSHPRE